MVGPKPCPKLQNFLNRSWAFASLRWAVDSLAAIRLLQEATYSALAQNLTLHWPDEICLLYPGDSLVLCPTKLTYNPKALLAVESYRWLAGSLRSLGALVLLLSRPRLSTEGNKTLVHSLVSSTCLHIGSNIPRTAL